MDHTENIRKALLQAFADGVRAVEGERVAAHWLADHRSKGPVAVIALGKAAGAMALGAQHALGDRLWRGLVVTKPGHADEHALDLGRIRICEGAHPVPDDSSLAAGQALLEFIEELPVGLPVVVLISGGASALVEVLHPGVELQGLSSANAWMLANGLPIASINAVRRRLSRLKGGGLAALLGQRPISGLLISDVEGDDPAVIGSGPLTPPASEQLPDGLPDWLLDLLPPDVPQPAVPEVAVQVVAKLDDALAAAEQSLRAQGLSVQRYPDHLDAPLETIASQVVEAVRAQPGVVHLWGGEATVVLPANPGRGGRNQQLALHLASELATAGSAVALCAGTDGTDGPTSDAGGLIDHQTLERGRVEGLSAQRHLTLADAGTYLERTGDLVATGPTGTNVTDLVMAWQAETRTG